MKAAFGATGSIEAKTLRAARRGERRAFDELVAAMSPELSRFVARRVRPDDVDDAVQETWLAAWSSLDRFDGRSQFKTWLYGIAVNKTRDIVRARRRVENGTASFDHAVVEVGADPHEQTELRHTLEAALEELSSSQREVLELYYFAELTLAEVAKALDRNLNTVKYQFYRAHALVANAMGSPSGGENGRILGGEP